MNRQSTNKGKQLKMAREYRGYNQSELANQIEGLSQANLSKFEKGFEGMISDEKLKVIMQFLDWPFDWLDVKHPQHYGL